jgi:acyl-CoA thioesterase-2
MLSVQPEGHRAWTSQLESFWGSSLGGDLLGRAVLVGGGAAGAAPLCAAQSHFVGQAPPERPLRFTREALAAGCSRVEVHDTATHCASITLRFGPETAGLTYQSLAAEGGLPSPESLPCEAETAEQEGWGPYAAGPIESRRISPVSPVKDDESSLWLGWLRPKVALGDDPLLHNAALAFLSEYRSHWAVERRLGAAFQQTELTLLDHSLWIHRPLRWDDWWLVRTESEIAVGGRCLSRRTIFTREGALVASAAWQHEAWARA